MTRSLSELIDPVTISIQSIAFVPDLEIAGIDLDGGHSVRVTIQTTASADFPRQLSQSNGLVLVLTLMALDRI
ncbi:hypothetical protein OIU13_00060 [Brevundimonas sp. BT-123]|uniref:hypothetical protein n=1 Tax=Brevundimonas sp. BT-123 TaxID=2986928 RepID=UPI002236423B|nr:hypothetical protein [Brevundimonas sp. BT-123]MCW0044932.1 hypothetical protein [Brevundimonas sp. BT-123]